MNGEYALKDYNLNLLNSILSRVIGEEFPENDIYHLYDMILKLIHEKSIVTTRSDRFITKDDILAYLDVPSFQRTYFTGDYGAEDIARLDGQSILEGKLMAGGFSSEFIERAKLVRYATKYTREKLSKFKSRKELIDDFEFRLRNICVEVFEEHIRVGHFDSLRMYQDLQQKLISLSEEEKYKRLDLNPDFIKGLIYEATSVCIFRWSSERSSN